MSEMTKVCGAPRGRAHFFARLNLGLLAFILLADALLLGLEQVELLEIELLHGPLFERVGGHGAWQREGRGEVRE